jgi:aspartate beta-hydroxylase
MLQKLILKRLTKRLRQVYSDLDTPPILDMARYFPAHAALAALYPTLRAEALTVYAANPDIPRFHDITATQTRLSGGDGKNWRMFMVKAYRHVIAANAAQTPVLAGFLRDHPEVTTATLSCLDPGKHIPPHRGPFRGVLRYHLCLYAPDCGTQAAPWLAVDGTRVPYAEGQALLWDDTFTHEVLNPGPSPRIALLLDIRRPVTRWRHRAAFRWVMAAGWVQARLLERRMTTKT